MNYVKCSLICQHISPKPLDDEQSTVVPDREEQDQIAHTLDTAQRKIDSAKNKKSALKNLFHMLLQQLMTAEIRVNDLNLDELGLELVKKKWRPSDNKTSRRQQWKHVTENWKIGTAR